ncbi:MAG: hypothetical protein ABSD74_11825 [Rhizomicrobium sp.]|jgi:hypothetical protein
MITRSITNGLMLAGVLLVSAAGIKIMQHAHLIDPQGATRGIQIVMGLTLAWIGNLMPKAAARRSPTPQGGRAQSALRAGGWAFVIAGLCYAALGAFAPLDSGGTLAMAIVAAATVFTIGYGLWACALSGRANRPEVTH